ncbi:MAG TPA: hypothetical protein VF502_00460 [Stellaceae bacterium]
MTAMTRRCAAAVLMLGLLPLAGCGIREASLGDRCADAMKQAFPGGSIKVTNSQVAQDSTGASLTAMIARVDGVRTEVPAEGPLARDVAVECRFEENVLTSFRWTAGPLQRSSGGR